MTNLYIIYPRGGPSCRVNSLMSALASRLSSRWLFVAGTAKRVPTVKTQGD